MERLYPNSIAQVVDEISAQVGMEICTKGHEGLKVGSIVRVVARLAFVAC